jgi:heptosyltransferase-2
MYPIEKWVELVDSIQALRIFLIGAPSEHGVCEAIISSCSNKNVFNLCGSMSLLQSAALMKDAVMNFTNDSAPCHLAGALNAPVTAIFCSTLPEFGFTPVSDRSAVVQTSRKLPCRPCGLHGKKKCPEKHFACGHTIDTRALLEHIPIQYRKKIE